MSYFIKTTYPLSRTRSFYWHSPKVYYNASAKKIIGVDVVYTISGKYQASWGYYRESFRNNMNEKFRCIGLSSLGSPCSQIFDEYNYMTYIVKPIFCEGRKENKLHRFNLISKVMAGLVPFEDTWPEIQ